VSSVLASEELDESSVGGYVLDSVLEEDLVRAFVVCAGHQVE